MVQIGPTMVNYEVMMVNNDEKVKLADELGEQWLVHHG